MATIAIQAAPARVGRDITTPLTAAAGGGDKFLYTTGQELVIVKNGDSGSHTITFTIQATVDGVTPGGKAVVVPAGKTYVIGPFDKATYADGNSFVNWTYDAVTSVTVGVLQPL